MGPWERNGMRRRRFIAAETTVQSVSAKSFLRPSSRARRGRSAPARPGMGLAMTGAMIVAALLSVLIGLALGLLGGGGSILTVPILVYALDMEPKTAIATSLVIVGVTSLAAVVPHARAGRVRWRTATVFGGTGMVGAYTGGRLAAYVPPSLLLLGFAAMMLATALAMIRGREPQPAATEALGEACPTGMCAPARIALHGLVVGLVTGMVGAGGGFLVVPALALLGGLPMPVAVGTSLLVIAIKSLAGFWGHLGHVQVPWATVLVVTVAATAGALVGSRLVDRVPARVLRQTFGWLVLVMAVFLMARQLPPVVRDSAAYRAVFVERWPFYVAGPAVGAFVLLMLWLDNKLLGVSTGCAELSRLHCEVAARRSWRVPFIGGIVLGGGVAGLLGGGHPTFALGRFDTLFSASPLVKIPVLLGAGFLIGFGGRTAGGCTSGHAIVGVAQGSKASLLATAAFLIGGFGTTQLVLALAS